MSATKKTNLNSVSELRNTVDENLPLTFGELGFTQSFSIIDIKLALGYATVALAGGLFVVDKKLGFEDAYWITVALIVAYFGFSAVLYYITSLSPYKDNKYIGFSDSGSKLMVKTTTTKYDPIYNVEIDLDGKKATTSFEFMKVFDSFGYYKQEETTEILKKELAKIKKKHL